jgi:DNA topoisomerase-1
MRRLVIVESGTKAKKIQQYLGRDYVVEASVGHIRDLPRGAADVPAKYKGEPWARLGVDVDNQFAPLYIITPEKKGKVAELKDALKSVDEILLATDPDREGEAIAWHLLDTLKPKIPVRRMVFHEISESAIRAAVENLRDLDHDLVDAQETRRILDRLYGYEVSPVLWKKVMPKRAGCSRWPRGSSCSASVSAWRSSRRPTGTSPPRWTPAPRPLRGSSRRGWSPSTGSGSPRAATSAPTGS